MVTRPLPGLLCAQAVSLTGSRMSLVALPWFVLVTTGSATRMGLIGLVEMLPYVLSTVLAAPAIDRIGARFASITCDVGSFGVVAAVPLLHQQGALSFGLLCVLVAMAGALRGPGDNAKYVLLPAAAEVAGTPMPRASALYDAVSRASALLGAPVAGVLIGALGAVGVLVVDAGTFLCAALLVGATAPRGRVRDARDSPNGSYVRAIHQGVRFLARDRILALIVGMLFFTNLLDQGYNAVLLPVWSRDAGHGGLGVGLVVGTFAAGATIAASGMALIRFPTRRRVMFAAAFLLAGAPRFVALAVWDSLGGVLPVALLAGLGAGVLNPILTVVETDRIPGHLRSRVTAAGMAIGFAGVPIGGLLAGMLTITIGVHGTLLAFGAVYLVSTASLWLPAWHGMDSPVWHERHDESVSPA